MVKAIFFDIDGTLISFKTHKIPQSTMQALQKLHKKGCEAVYLYGQTADGHKISDEGTA